MFGDTLYKDIFKKAVVLYEAIAKNHFFYNANKRTAFAYMTYFLFINGQVCVNE
ncbi:type II toxin-antitoxin system death-on-curing family toxin [Niallia taxi]|nr:type II toxin-antitoxin system death-on-curing family toxin [Niallia taxi]MDK8643431.1 type II toxin-antitoxin system death-on-curing family toxin [Niallia taxi]